MRTGVLAPDFRDTPFWWDAAEPAARGGSLPSHAAVAVVGGGCAGLSAALTLARRGLQPVVIDAERIGWGSSSRSGGAVSGGLRMSFGDLSAAYGEARARTIVRAAADALPFLEGLIAREAIDCGYRRSGRFVAAWTRSHYDALARRAALLAEVTGQPARMIPPENQKEVIGSDRYRGGLLFEAAGTLDPALFVRGLADAAEAAGARLVDGVRAKGIDVGENGGHVLDTSKGKLRADAVLVTAESFLRGPSGASVVPLPVRQAVPAASILIATEHLGEALVDRLFPGRRTISDTQRVLNHFHPSPDGKHILWGGRVATDGATPVEAVDALHRAMVRVFPALRDVKVTHAWNGDVAPASDVLPHLGISENIHYAAGAPGSGAAMACWLGHRAALRLADADPEGFALTDLAAEDALPPAEPRRSWFLPGLLHRLGERFGRRSD